MRSIFSLSAALALATVGVASASVIPFSPTGDGVPVAVASFDLLPGNALIVPAGNSTSAPAATVYYQARVGALLDGAGHPIPLPGLNNDFEITAVFGIDVGIEPGSTPGSGQLFSFGPTSGNAYFSVYFDRNVNASDLAGTGFRDGTRILSSPIGLAIGSIISVPFTFPLDNFNPANYPAITSDMASGGIKVASEFAAVDPNFFPAAPAFGFFADTTLAAPFFHTDPSALFEIGPDGSALLHPANIDPVNGEGDEVVLESDGSIGFLPVPEPASLSLLAIGATSLLARRRSRK
jgi:hypothetical protein